MTVTTTSTLTAPVNYVFQRRLLKNAKARCPYFEGSTPGDILPSHEGTFSVRWRRIENLTPTTSALSEETGSRSFPLRTGSVPTITQPTATVAKYGDVIYPTEEADLINYNGQTAKLIEILAIQAGRSLNRLQRNILEDNVTLYYASNGTADGDVTDAISRGLIKKGTNVLNNASGMTFTNQTTGSTSIGTTPIRSGYLGICHVDVEEDVRELSGFIAAERYASQTALFQNEFGAVGGVRWVCTEEASKDASLGGDPGQTLNTSGSNKADLYTSVIMGMDAHGALSLDRDLIRTTYKAGDKVPGIIAISHPKGSAGSADALNEMASLGWKSWHAGTILNDTWAIGLRTGASKL
jgi:N4-gp56 family major capsid protein